MYGPESSGKTTLALHAMAAVQKAGGNALLVDAEHAFDAQYAKVIHNLRSHVSIYTRSPAMTAVHVHHIGHTQPCV